MISRFQNDSNNRNSTYNYPFQNGCYKTRVLEPFTELYELNIILYVFNGNKEKNISLNLVELHRTDISMLKSVEQYPFCYFKTFKSPI